MAHNDEHKRGQAMIRKREQILADLRKAAQDLDAGIDETRATLALEMVEKIRDDMQKEHAAFRKEIEELVTAAVEAISLTRDLAVAEYNGEYQGAREKRAVLVKHGLIKE